MMALTEAQDVRSLIKKLDARLREAGVVTARAEAEWLLAESLGMSRTELYLQEEPIKEPIIGSILELLKRRIKGESLQYLLGHTDFLGLRLTVSPGVFIPRPETEVLTQQAIQHLGTVIQQGTPSVLVLDVGTGSANIAISLAHAIPTCVVIGVELSWDALRVAKANVDTHRLHDRVRLIQSDLTSGVRGSFDLVISNPPYVSRDELEQLGGCPACAERGGGDDGAAGRQEPRVALDGGPDGMAFHRRLIAEAPRLLARGGALCVECAEAQARPLVRLVSAQGWVKHARVIEDLAGRPRGLWIESW